jgi:hypothetical protein
MIAQPTHPARDARTTPLVKLCIERAYRSWIERAYRSWIERAPTPPRATGRRRGRRDPYRRQGAATPAA